MRNESRRTRLRRSMFLVIGATLTLREYRHLLRRNNRIERELGATSGAFQDVARPSVRPPATLQAQ